MEKFGIIRKVDDCGKITIPREMRKKLGIKDGDAIEFFLENYNQQIILKPVKNEERD